MSNIFGKEGCEVAKGTCRGCCWALRIPETGSEAGEKCREMVPKGCNLHGLPTQPTRCNTRCEDITDPIQINLIIGAAKIEPGLTADEEASAKAYMLLNT